MTKSLITSPTVTLMMLFAGINQLSAQTASYTVTLDEPANGSVTVDPTLPADGEYPAGTVITITARPDPGFAVDALYYSVPGPWGVMYHDTPSVSSLEVTVDQDKHVGAYFIGASALEGFTETQDVVYAKPGVKPLKYDVYSPEGAENLPIVVIIHGGGWSSNDEDIMRGQARQLVKSGKYVVASIDYRWNATLDGDEPGNTMANLIEDVYGALAHIREHAEEYGGDPDRIAVTGDSAGGHLSAAAATMADMIGSGGFGETPGVYEYMPSYLPDRKTVEQVRTEMISAIRAAAPSYGVFAFEDSEMLEFLNMSDADPAALRAISPINNIPKASEQPIPHYLTRGVNDPIITDEGVTAYMEALADAGHAVEYVQIGGATHAFFDWKPDDEVVATFDRFGVYYCGQMELFFDSVFYGR
jgi:acetyl esterase/lipase